MTGHLELELVGGTSGITHIGRQSFHAPMHLSKPYWDGRHLIVQMVNCTAGLLSGDVIDISVQSRAGSSAVLTSPSAQRAFRVRDGGTLATVNQTFSVEAGAWLEVCPEIFIPHKGSRLRQATRIEAATDAEMLFIESLAPGRVGSAESYAFARLEWVAEVYVDGRLQVRERYDLSPEQKNIETLRKVFPDAYYASCYLVTPCLDRLPDLRAAMRDSSASDLLMAASVVAPNVAAFRLLAAGSIALRRGIQVVREYCYGALGRRLPDWRKL